MKLSVNLNLNFPNLILPKIPYFTIVKFILHTFLATLMLFANSSCKSLHQNSIPYSPVKSILLEKLEAKELSENRSALSSKKDEIIAFAYYLKSDSIVLDKWHQENLSFTETASIQNIDTSFTFSDVANSKLVFILVELDTRTRANEMDRIFQSNLHLLTRSATNKTTLQLLLGDDDLLDIKVINLKKSFPQKHFQVQFSGVHLFDDFEYILHCELN